MPQWIGEARGRAGRPEVGVISDLTKVRREIAKALASSLQQVPGVHLGIVGLFEASRAESAASFVLCGPYAWLLLPLETSAFRQRSAGMRFGEGRGVVLRGRGLFPAVKG